MILNARSEVTPDLFYELRIFFQKWVVDLIAVMKKEIKANAEQVATMMDCFEGDEEVDEDALAFAHATQEEMKTRAKALEKEILHVWNSKNLNFSEAIFF
jgi:hypothetical protein